MSYYHIYYNQEAVGPYELAQLKQMAQDGIITPETLVFPEGATDWLPAQKVDGIFEVAASAPEPTPVQEVVEEPIEEITPAHEEVAPAQKAPTSFPPKGLGPKPAMGAPVGGMKKAVLGNSPMKKAALGPKPTMGSPIGGLKKQATSAPKSAVGDAGAMNMTPEQKAAFDEAMAKRDASEGSAISKKKKLIIIGSVVFVTVIIAVAAGIFFMKSGSTKPVATPTEQAAESTGQDAEPSEPAAGTEAK
jgi:hypothetical protein